MKLFRFLLFLIILYLWAFAPSPENVAAQDAGSVGVSPGESQVAIGSEVVLEVIIEDGEDVNAFDLIVTYNPDLLTLVNWAYGDFLSNLADVTEENYPGSFHLVATQLATPPVSGDGVLLEITFQGLADGVSTIAITRSELADSQGNKLLPTVSDGSVAVGPPPTHR